MNSEVRGVAYNRYRGNSGRAERVDDHPPPPQPQPEPRREPPPPSPSPRSPQPQALPFKPDGQIARLLGQLGQIRLETEDLLLLAILYLLYRETKDEEFLIMMAGIVLF